MMKRSPHPTLEHWLDWIHERMGEEPSASMEDHLGTCTRCKDNLPMLRRLRSAQYLEGWRPPPDELRRKAARLPTMRRAPRPSVRTGQLEWQPSDIRGGSLVGASEPRTLNAVLAAAEMSIIATPPSEDAFWRIEGRVWLREDRDAKVEIVVVQDEHVIVHRTVADAEFFEICEILPPDWELEVHLPGKKTLTLSDRDS